MLSRRIHSIVLLIALLIGAAGMNYVQAQTSGSCGTNVTWTLSDGVLTISGTGEMASWSAPSHVPWSSRKNGIRKVVVESGVTSIGNLAFYECGYLTSAQLPSGLTTIRFGAFYHTGLTSITIPNSVTTLGSAIFQGCYDLTNIYVSWTENIPAWTEYFTTKLPQSSIKLHVPCGMEALYEAADGWKDYTIVEEPMKGTCGAEGNENNVTWSLSCDGVLTITGTGAMAGWENIADIPWYSYQESITSVIIEDGVTNIGRGAFYKISSLLSATIPSSVTSIDYCAFYECTSLVSVTIQEGLISFGASAFNGCSALTSAPIPNSVTSIGNSAFKNCSSLSSLTIPNGVETIGNSAFESCSGLTSVTIPNNVTRINEQAFRYCSSLTEVTIPGSVTRLSSFAFANCSALTSVVISEGVEIIDMAAFQKCSHLTTVTFPSSVTGIYVHSFTFCSAITDIYVSWTENIPHWNNITNRSPQSDITLHIPCGTEELYNDANGWNGYTISDGSVRGTCGVDGDNLTWTLCEGILTISGSGAMKDWNTLSDIPWYSQRPSIQHIVVEEGVTTLGKNAFRGCSNMTSVSLPSTLTDLGYQTFYNCSSLTSISIPEGITIMPASTFYECTSLTSISLPNTLERINDYAFKYCSSLTSLTIPNSVKYLLGRDILEYCSALKDVYVSWTSNVPQWNFYPYTSMNAADIKLHIPCGTALLYSTSTQWMWRSFFVLDDGSVSGTCGVTGNEANVNWTLSCDSILTISGTGAMADYTNTNNLPWVTHRDAIKTIIVEEGITAIGDRAFGYSTNATSVSLPSSVTSIGDYAFISCSSLQEITIPNMIDALGTHMLYACGSLTDIYVSWTSSRPEWPTNFTNKSPQSDITLHVPCEAIELYNAANGWKDYTIEGEGGPYTVTVQADDASMGMVQLGTAAEQASFTEQFNCGEEITITAIPANGYAFDQWSDNSTQASRTITITSDTTLTALFKQLAYPVEHGALPGVFSVSDTKKVVFSQGNLQFNAALGTHQRVDGTTANGTWRFAENQYDFVGDNTQGNVYYNDEKCSNERVSNSYNGWIDYFNHGNTGYSDKSPTRYTTAFGMNFNSPSVYDWGSYVAISNGGNMTGYYIVNGWIVLQRFQWNYLFNSRANAQDLRSLATVNDVLGCILLPDDWQLPSGIVFTPDESSYATNTYTREQWNRMEQAGAVFLPAAGRRDYDSNGSPQLSYPDIQTAGYVWSSSGIGNQGVAVAMSFGIDNFALKTFIQGRNNYDGLSVRLAHYVSSYHVIFRGYKDGEENVVLQDKLVAEGAMPIPPEVPEDDCRTFIGWDRVIEPASGDTEYIAQYELKGPYTVTVTTNDASMGDVSIIVN